MRVGRPTTLALLLCALPASAQSPRWFAPEAATPNVRVHSPYVLADLDGDGLHDLTRFGRDDPADLLIERGLGDSTFAPATTMPTTITDPYRLRLHDVDGDGSIDLLAGGVFNPPGPDISYEVHLLLGDGAGGFLPGWVRVEPDDVEAVGLVDLDGDADPDLLVVIDQGTAPQSLLELWHNDGTGQTSFVQALQVPTLPRLLFDDVGGSADVDVIASGQGETAVLLGAGAGTLSDHFRFAAGRDVDYVDVDGDGRKDLVDLRQGNLDRLEVWRGRPLGRFELAAASTLHFHAVLPRMADLDGDGLADLVAHANGLGHGFFPGRGDLTVETGRPAIELPGILTGDLSTADVDGDGVVDLLVPAYAFGAPGPPGDIAVFHGVGDGTFGAPVEFRTGPAPRVVVGGDVNGDGHTDLVVASQNNHLYTMLADGMGGFLPYTDVVNAQLFVLLEHMNTDAHLDVITTASDQIFVRRGNGDGTWGPPKTVPSMTWRADAADLDGDGDVDLATNGEVRLNIGHLDLGPALPLDTGPWPIQPAIADFDEDGVPDLAMGRRDDDGRVAARILLGNGDGTFTPHLDLEAPDGPLGSCMAGDVDGDGHADVAVTLDWGVAVWAGRGDGGFDPPRVVAIGGGPNEIALRDLDGDGFIDLAIHRFQHQAFVLLNRLGPWRDIGFGLAAGAVAPHLGGQGSLEPGTTVGLHLTDAAALAHTILVLGLDIDALPFAGGTLAPALDLVLPGLSTDIGGRLSLTGAWPAGVPAGLQVFFQTWVEDVAGPQGYTASNALEATAP